MGYHGIVVIIERGKANAVVKKAAEAGAKGATIAYGRGSGEQTFSFFRSLQIEPSKEIILIITTDAKLRTIYDVVVEAGRVNQQGKGVAFTFPINNLAGYCLESGDCAE